MFNRFQYILRKKLTRSMQEGDITFEQLSKMVKEGAYLLDVRSPQEYREGHIEGAILIPQYELRFRKNDLPKDKNKNIVVYCQSGGRSRKTCSYLKSIGYNNVYNLYGGLQNL